MCDDGHGTSGLMGTPDASGTRHSGGLMGAQRMSGHRLRSLLLAATCFRLGAHHHHHHRPVLAGNHGTTWVLATCNSAVVQQHLV